ncbi:MAG: DUF5302 domain-containing protein, partial [Ruthenibacterium lactatiformans]
MMQEKECTDIWRRYQAGKDHHNRTNMYTQAEKCHRFYEGDQWHGLQAGDEELPMLNFIKPICRYKIVMVAMNDTAILFSPMDNDPKKAEICEALTAFAAGSGKASWTAKWAVVKTHYRRPLSVLLRRAPSESVVTDMTPRLKMRLIDKTALYLADEQEPNLEEQEWIIIAERVPVENVRRQAKDNGLPEAEIRRIVSDEADETQLGVTGADEVQTDSGKCTSLLFMRKTDGGVAFCRSTQAVVYQPMQNHPRPDVYPVCGMRWEEKMGSARGVGVVETLIPNQIEVNRTLARRAICVKRYSFPTVVYDQDKLLAPEKLGVVGASIGVKNLNANPVGSFVQYLNPAPISGDAANLQAELVGTSRELEGAGEAATGQVDPTKASGEAIKAARDQSAISLNEQSAAYKQFVEDLAMIWYKLGVAYSVRARLADGTCRMRSWRRWTSTYKYISPITRSVLSRELSLENALAQQHITFEEYVEALDDNSGVPKDKFRAILDRRRGAAPEQSEMRPNGSKRRGASAGPRQAELGGVASTLPPAGALPGMELVGGGVPGGLPGAGMPVQG